MPDWHWITEMVKTNGLAVLLFAVFLFYLRTQAKAAEQQRQADAERERRNFDLLNGFLETLQCQIAQLTRIENKIDSNHYCPIMRDRKGVLRDGQ